MPEATSATAYQGHSLSYWWHRAALLSWLARVAPPLTPEEDAALRAYGEQLRARGLTPNYSGNPALKTRRRADVTLAFEIRSEERDQYALSVDGEVVLLVHAYEDGRVELREMGDYRERSQIVWTRPGPGL